MSSAVLPKSTSHTSSKPPRSALDYIDNINLVAMKVSEPLRDLRREGVES